MKPVIVLIGVFLVSLLATQFITGNLDFSLSGRIGMSTMLLLTGVGHFKFSEGMTLMIPKFIPFKKPLVYLTGIFEIISAVLLLVPEYVLSASYALIVFFILVLPANINAAIHHIDYEMGTKDGNGLKYLWFRIPLQLLFIGWVFLFGVADIIA